MTVIQLTGTRFCLQEKYFCIIFCLQVNYSHVIFTQFARRVLVMPLMSAKPTLNLIR